MELKNYNKRFFPGKFEPKTWVCIIRSKIQEVVSGMERGAGLTAPWQLISFPFSSSQVLLCII